MNYSFYDADKRADRIEQRVNEHVSFADDEIENYSHYLQSLKYDIQEVSDQIKYIDEQNLLRKSRISSERLHQNLQKKMTLIHENSIHQSKLRKINFDHSQKISAMIADFDDLFNSMTQWTEQVTSKKVDPINKKLAIAQKKLSRLQGMSKSGSVVKGYLDDSDDDITMDDLLDHSDDEIKDRDEQLQNSRIQNLESSIERKKKERMNDLEKVKKQLETCITLIQSMASKNKKEKDSITKKLKANDAAYNNKMKKVNNDYKRDINDLKIKVEESEKLAAQIEQEIENKMQEFTTRMLSLKKESDIKKSEMISLNQSTNFNSSTLNEKSQLSIQMESELMQKQEELDQKRRILANELEVNATLKRELNLKKIDQKLEMRREARK